MVSRRWLMRHVRPGEMPVDKHGVPSPLRKASAVVRNYREAEDLVKFYGSPDYMPPRGAGVILLIPRQKPVYVETNGERTATELRDKVCGVWQQVLADIRSDPDEGRFDLKDFPYMPHQRQVKTLEINGLARLLRDPDNEVMNPDRQPWQDRPFRVLT